MTTHTPDETAPPEGLARPVRITYDAPPTRYRAFDEWRRDAAFALGRPRVTLQEALDALVSRLVTDEALSRRITEDLR